MENERRSLAVALDDDAGDDVAKKYDDVEEADGAEHDACVATDACTTLA